MAASGFAYSHLFTKDLPPAAPRWTGFPKYNFIGGHNDPEHVPAAALAAAAAAALRRDGADLALYNPHGPQGFHGIREFVVGKVAGRGIHCSPDEVLITSGSGQGLDLVNRVLLERGDTVILEEFTYGGALTKLQRCGVKVVGAPLDDDGLRIDALAQILDDLKRKGTVPKYIYTIPTVQNPTGSILPLDRRRELLGARQKARRADIRGRVLRRSRVGRRGAAGDLFDRPKPSDPCRLVLEDIVAGLAPRLRRRRLGGHEPARRLQARD